MTRAVLPVRSKGLGMMNVVRASSMRHRQLIVRFGSADLRRLQNDFHETGFTGIEPIEPLRTFG